MSDDAAPAADHEAFSRSADDRRWRLPSLGLGLSGKLLVLTVIFVLIAEILIYVPAIANFRLNWLNDRLAAANTAALVLEAAPSGMVPDSLTAQLLDSIGARAVAMKMGNQRRLLALGDPPTELSHDVDMRNVAWAGAVYDALETLARSPGDNLIRVVGPPPMGGDFIEIVLEEAPLRAAMIRFSGNVLLVSLLISIISAGLVYIALHYVFVRPLRRLTGDIVAFRRDPENPARIVAVTDRADELGTATRELAAMQQDIASMLQQKSRLAALGLAVAKINHDLRNLLTSAQLFSDRLSSLPDPAVQRFSPKLVRALERAIAFCESTLSYGRAQEPPPDRRMVLLEPLIDEVRETLGLEPDGPIRWICAVERGLRVDADHDQMFRILLNLSRNAMQALNVNASSDPGRNQIRLTGRREGAVSVIEVSDTGPGLPPRFRERLFEAFHGSTRGGAGLGLAIAAELVRAHGGSIRLVAGTLGATFHIVIPDRPVDIALRRSA